MGRRSGYVCALGGDLALSCETMTIPPALPIALADLEADIASGRRELLTILAAMHNVPAPRQAAMQDQISELVNDLARLDNMRRGCCAANLDE